jgi:hypothetical protein
MVAACIEIFLINFLREKDDQIFWGDLADRRMVVERACNWPTTNVRLTISRKFV